MYVVPSSLLVLKRLNPLKPHANKGADKEPLKTYGQ
jgi:hypothetical protein